MIAKKRKYNEKTIDCRCAFATTRMWRQEVDFVCVTCREFETTDGREILFARQEKDSDGVELLVKSLGWITNRGLSPVMTKLLVGQSFDPVIKHEISPVNGAPGIGFFFLLG